MKSLICLLLLTGSLSAATTFTGTGVSADINVNDQHTLSVSISGTFVATIVLERAVSGGYQPIEVWSAGVTYKPPALTGIWRLRCSDYTSGTVTYVLTSVANNQVIYRKPNGTTAFSVDVDGLVTSSGGAVSGGTIDNTPIGGTTPAAGAFTTLSATGAITSTLAIGTSPFAITSTTVVPNLNVSQLLGNTWAVPGTIGSTTPNSGVFSSLTNSALTTRRLVFSSTAGLEADSANLTYSTAGLLAIGAATAANSLTVAGASGQYAAVFTANSASGNSFGMQILGGTTSGDQALSVANQSGGTSFLTIAGNGATATTGIWSYSNTTDATSSASGAITVTGGLGVAKNIVSKQGLGVGVTSTATAAGTTTLDTTATACQVFTGTTTQTVTLPAANAFGAGIAYVVYFKNVSTGVVTVQRAGADTINSTASNVTSFTLAQWATATLYSDGVSAWERF